MFVTIEDLSPFAEITTTKAEAMIADAEAQAVALAPCLVDPDTPSIVHPDLTPNDLAVILSVLRSAILRWNDSGSGGIVQQTAGPFSQTVDSRSNKYGRFWPSEIDQLQGICSQSSNSKAFGLSQVSSSTSHLGWCAYSLGATYCSCGVDIALTPIYELP